MDKSEILAMVGGRKLDELVAKEIFGSNKPDFIPKDALALSLVGTPFHYESWTCLCLYNKRDIPEWYADPYSTDISTAWQVVEELIKRYVFTLLYDDTGEIWVCKLFDGQNEFKGFGDAPEAISKAALLTKLGE